MLRGRWRNVIQFAVPIAVGTAFSIYPHLWQWFTNGNLFWIADNDEAGLYLPIASQAFWNHPTYLSDPLFAEYVPTNYPWLQFIPFVLLAKFFHWNLLTISFLWRMYAGLSISCAWLFLSRAVFPSKKWAFGATLLLLVDSGILESKLVFRTYQFILQIFHAHLTGTTLAESAFPLFHPEWRIITPGLSLALLLLFYGSVFRYRASEERLKIWIPGFCFGLLFYTYFYFWTAAGLGILLALVGDQKEFRLSYLKIGTIGAILGAYSIWSAVMTKNTLNNDWLERSDLFLSIPHFSELILPKIGIFLWVLCGIYLWRTRSDLKFLWFQVAAGFLLLNHQVFTGKQIQNFHWAYHWGPTLSFLVLACVADLYRSLQGKLRSLKTSSWTKGTVLGLGVLHICFCLALRHLEATDTFESKEITSTTNNIYKVLPKLSEILTPNAIIAGDEQLVNAASVLLNARPLEGYASVLSSQVSNKEWNERIAINAYISSSNVDQFRFDQQKKIAKFGWGSWSRSESGRSMLLEGRLSTYVEIGRNFNDYLRRYPVQFVFLKANSTSTPQALGFEEVYHDDNMRIFSFKNENLSR